MQLSITHWYNICISRCWMSTSCKQKNQSKMAWPEQWLKEKTPWPTRFPNITLLEIWWSFFSMPWTTQGWLFGKEQNIKFPWDIHSVGKLERQLKLCHRKYLAPIASAILILLSLYPSYFRMLLIEYGFHVPSNVQRSQPRIDNHESWPLASESTYQSIA